MDEIEKLLRKASKKDRERLLVALGSLQNGEATNLKIKKLTGSDFYRVRIGDYRIIFAFDKSKKSIIIETVRLRNEHTYD